MMQSHAVGESLGDNRVGHRAGNRPGCFLPRAAAGRTGAEQHEDREDREDPQSPVPVPSRESLVSLKYLRPWCARPSSHVSWFITAIEYIHGTIRAVCHAGT